MLFEAQIHLPKKRACCEMINSNFLYVQVWFAGFVFPLHSVQSASCTMPLTSSFFHSTCILMRMRLYIRQIGGGGGGGGGKHAIS